MLNGIFNGLSNFENILIIVRVKFWVFAKDIRFFIFFFWTAGVIILLVLFLLFS